MTADQAPLRLGLHGAGAFAAFVATSLRTARDVMLVAVSSRRPQTARAFAAEHGVETICGTFEELLASASVEAVAIATPPFDHATRAVAALRAGKHVMSEKPLATTLEAGESVLAAATHANKVVAVDYPMPYTAIVRAIGALVVSGAAGSLRRLDVTNVASCEGLGDDHWFWDRSKSGGILVEHGVHFFDWCGALLPQPECVGGWAASEGQRENRVFAAVSHAGGALATYYHAFIASSAAERTRTWLAFDDADALADGWIPTRLTIRGLARAKAAAAIRESGVAGLHETTLDDEIVFDAGDKQANYAASIRALFADFAQACADPKARMLVDSGRALSSLRVAVEARAAADEGRPSRLHGT